jgi:hypothetical protein
MIISRRQHPGTVFQAGPAQQAGTAVRHRRLALLLGATVLLSAACSSTAVEPQAAGSSAAPASSTAAVPAGPSDTGSPVASSTSATVPRSPATPVPTTLASSAPATPSQSAPAPTAAGCQAGALTVQALRGSGAAGHQYAFLQFTNKSARTCSLTGFPGVQLLRAGALLGKPAARANKPVTGVQLAPGRSATARLVDASTCEAEKSDSVQIIPPNQTQKFLVPLSIRGCALTIDPVIAG